MTDWTNIRESELIRDELRGRLKIEFITKFSARINHEPYKTIVIDMSSGCPGCRTSAYNKALKIMKE